MVKKSARRTRRAHTPAFKVRVALAALHEDKTMAELCQRASLGNRTDHAIKAGYKEAADFFTT